MSLQFSDTTNNNGILQGIERTIFGDDGIGRITGNTTLLKNFTSEVNLAFSNALAILFRADGRFQFDDTNHTDYPIITTNLIQGQQDYTLGTDGSGNLVLEIYKAAIKTSSTATTYEEIEPFDELADRDNAIVSGSTTQGVPSRYAKLASGIFLDVPPSYNATSGLKMFVNREQSFFLTTDTTKKPGFAGMFHEYLVLRPSYMYATRPGSNMSGIADLRANVEKMEKDIEEYYSRRDRDERHIIKPKITKFI